MRRRWMFGVGCLGFLAAIVVGAEAQGPGNGPASSKGAGEDLANGKAIFGRYCASCHGPTGEGDGYQLLGRSPADLTRPEVAKKSDAELLKAIHDGKPNMPPWNLRLSKRDSRDVLAYVRTLSR